jgi:phosphoglycerate dehydrogenase-like enzyme
VRRHVSGDEPVLTVNTSSVDEVLPTADHIVNILPANDQTRNFLNAKRLQNVKSGAVVYNIGRGTTLDQAALIEGLQSGRIGAAYLDVTDPEPLPHGSSVVDCAKLLYHASPRWWPHHGTGAPGKTLPK